MSLKVLSQVALLHKFFVTLLAFVGLDPLMHANMVEEITGFVEHLLTVWVLANVSVSDFLKDFIFFLDPLV